MKDGIILAGRGIRYMRWSEGCIAMERWIEGGRGLSTGSTIIVIERGMRLWNRRIDSRVVNGKVRKIVMIG